MFSTLAAITLGAGNAFADRYYSYLLISPEKPSPENVEYIPNSIAQAQSCEIQANTQMVNNMSGITTWYGGGATSSYDMQVYFEVVCGGTVLIENDDYDVLEDEEVEALADGRIRTIPKTSERANLVIELVRELERRGYTYVGDGREWYSLRFTRTTNQATAPNNTNDKNALVILGMLTAAQNDLEKALSFFNEAIALDPNFSEAYTRRGNIYAKQQEWGLALADYNKAITLAPNDGFAYYSRGKLYAKTGDKKKATDDWTSAAKIFHSQGEDDIVLSIMKEIAELWKKPS